MLIQHTPLIPDVEYFLDAALEHTEIDAASHIALKLYGERRQITNVVDDVPPVGHYLGTIGGMRDRLSRCERMMALADTVIAGLDADRRAAVCYAGFSHLRYEIDRTANFLATSAHQDQIAGGCMLPFKRLNTRWARAYLPSPKQRRQLYGRNWVRRYVKMDPTSVGLRAMGARALRRAVGVDLESARADGERLSREVQAQHEAYNRFNERLLQQYFVKQPRILPKPQRAVIKRAAATAVALVGHADVAAFARGQRVIIPGDTIALEISRMGSSAQTGHGALSVVAVDKDHGGRLANLCVYHENTPALDQFTALVLAMRAGDEEEILKTANLSRVTELGRQYPLIAERGPADTAWEPRTPEARADDAYWHETKPIWREALGTFVLGRMWAKLERGAQAVHQ